VSQLKDRGQPKLRQVYGVTVAEPEAQPVMVFLTCRIPSDLREAVATRCHQLRMPIQEFTALALEHLLEELAEAERR
jgi:hypothetical protein